MNSRWPVSVTTNVTLDVWHAIEREATRFGIPRSHVIRNALDEHLRVGGEPAAGSET
jgi:hypothetical protein